VEAEEAAVNCTVLSRVLPLPALPTLSMFQEMQLTSRRPRVISVCCVWYRMCKNRERRGITRSSAGAPSSASPHHSRSVLRPRRWNRRCRVRAELGFAAAVNRRMAGQDIVVRGRDLVLNRNRARDVEAGVRPPTRPQLPHANKGSLALPHFHQRTRVPPGHSFYETD
jgi:hypothetical protein